MLAAETIDNNLGLMKTHRNIKARSTVAQPLALFTVVIPANAGIQNHRAAFDEDDRGMLIGGLRRMGPGSRPGRRRKLPRTFELPLSRLQRLLLQRLRLVPQRV